ncbi:anthranilate synthase family protein [Actinoplanes sp. NPDC051494]|uniref:anthranilate synthase family protein n=1 Tax=Actinoplanes sp. NPDC051494 TaxID=3363907 RepID=UPI0037911CE7
MKPAGDLLTRVLGTPPPAFALIHRPRAGSGDRVDVLTGDVRTVSTLADLPLRDGPGGGPHDLLAVVPYRQITERGYDCVDDGAPLLAMRIGEQDTVDVARVLAELPVSSVRVTGARFDVGDAGYAESVHRVVTEEIGTGEGANFVIRRSYRAEIEGWSAARALALFRSLLLEETGSYWTFVIHTGDRTFVGATPERHITVDDGDAVMNPISGTFRYGDRAPTVDDILGFLADHKERDELSMVLDEELKVMGRICADGGRVVGPYLRGMTRLAHTEYFIEGRTDRDVREILRETMFAPTVVGSPLENACRVIARHESTGRGYYSGVAALISRPTGAGGGRDLDSAILIRTAEVTGDGGLRIGAGATLVRHSDAAAEVAETKTKIATLLAALRTDPAAPPRALRRGPELDRDPRVRAALAARGANTAAFWFGADRDLPHPGELAGRRVLVVDAEDTFTWMLFHQLRSLGLDVVVKRHDEVYDVDDHDLVVLGPGPGDPGDPTSAKMARLRELAADLLRRRRPFLAVCLSHQVLSGLLGLPVARRETPHQGVQLVVDLFGRDRAVGFYNTFAAFSGTAKIETPDGDVVEISRDPDTGEVYALRSATFASVQCHLESVLTRDGVDILAETVTQLLGR